MRREIMNNLYKKMASVTGLIILVFCIQSSGERGTDAEMVSEGQHHVIRHGKINDISISDSQAEEEDSQEDLSDDNDLGGTESEDDEAEKESGEFEHQQILLKEINGGWRLTLFDQNKEEVLVQNYNTKPGISTIENSDLLEIKESENNASGYIFYFDPQKAIWTDRFFNPFFFKFDEKDCVAYMENERTLVFKELFGEGKEGKIERDFTPYVSPIIYVGRLTEKNMVISYWKGSDAVQTEEIFAVTGEKPVVNYGETPYILTPQIRNFFYGGNWCDEDWSNFGEESDDAQDYGFEEWHWPGCNRFCAVRYWETYIEASSELESEVGKYSPGVLSNDAGRETAWSEGVEGPGIGERIALWQCCGYYSVPEEPYLYDPGFGNEPYLVDGNLTYTEICIVNGYAKNEKTWEENGRVKRLLMLVEGQPFAYLELEDTIKPQYFTLPEKAIVVPNEVFLACEFIIEEVYPGTKYEDTCLTGLVMEFEGGRGH